jgi:outer membrane protein assembly factor BamB
LRKSELEFMSRWQIIVSAPLAALVLSSCASVSERAQALWPFGGGGSGASGPAEPQDGRISIVALEQKLEADATTSAIPVVLPPESPAVDWANAGGAVDNAPGARAWSGNLQVAWRRSAGNSEPRRSPFVSPPVVLNGGLFLVDGQHNVRAFDAATGAPRWSVNIRPERTRDRNAILGGVAASGNKVFVTSGYGEVVALEASNGSVLWRTKSSAPFHVPPTANDTRVFAITNDSEMMALDANDGRVLWSDQAIAEPARVLSSPSPAFAGDTVVAPFASGELIAFLPANGRRLWTDALTRAGRLNSLSAINDIAGRPVVADGVTYAVSHSGVLAAIDIRTGDRIWQRGAASIQTPLVAGNQLYVITIDGELIAFDRATGGIHWVKQLKRWEDENDREGRIAWTGPILAGGKLVLANSRGEVVLVDPVSGNIAQEQRLGQPFFVPPIVAGGLVYLLSAEGTLYALR